MSNILENHKAAAFAILDKADGLSAVEYFLVRYAIKSQFEAASKASAEQVPELLSSIPNRISALANNVFKREVNPNPLSNDMAYVIDKMGEIISESPRALELPNAYEEQTETPKGWQYHGPITPEDQHPQLKPCDRGNRYIIESAEQFRAKIEHHNNETNVEELVAETGGSIIDNAKYEEHMSYYAYINGNNNRYAVLLSGSEMRDERRYRIAKVLGFYALHFLLPKEEGVPLSDIQIQRTSFASLPEGQANLFACALLMPIDSVFDVLEKETDYNAYAYEKGVNYMDADRWFSAIMQNAL